MRDYIKNNLKPILWAMGALLLWYGLNQNLAEYSAIIGPEFITRCATKIFGVALAAVLTFHCDKWVAPTIEKWCSKRTRPMSDFEHSWMSNPNDPRLKICVMLYLGLFIGLSLVFAL